MRVITLMDNVALTEEFLCEHGLSLYVETKNHKILFDTGATGGFAENAEKLNVDLAQVDIAFISHGHYDHGGGLETFLKLNSQAKIYIHEKAFQMQYADRENGVREYIGLPRELESLDRFVRVGEELVIDEELNLFSNVSGHCLSPTGNAKLLTEKEGAMVPDGFEHEQNLLIKEGGKTLLLAGCAHKGIVNIMEHLRTSKHGMPDYVIGGFHLYSRSGNDNESPKRVRQIGLYLKTTKPKYYTCHCTGMEAYHELKKIMGDKIDYLAAGSILTL